ncbi:MAG TPA: tripartite tricarboxylate transporter substrate-binding protein [Candidatus Binatia bacterium]|jgi:tripartite-type tricarboxylate transporter receptor subunit TctC|nr:tripartite tricarboxylate transporter substrate-binding protein [Candidatus Binatia bacterium]
MKKFLFASALLAIFANLLGAGMAAEQQFYRGKTIRIVVGFAAGGGFDTYARTIARHLGKHIPGNPAVIVDNMGGAGSLLAANDLYNRAKPDGLTIGNFIGSLVLQQLFETKGVEFDGRKFEWLGVPVQDSTVCALTKASGITSLERWFAAKEPVKLGGEAPGANDSDVPRVLKVVLALPIQLVEGYKGTSQIRLAADAGEIAGGCWTWESIKTTWRQGLESGNVNVIIQVNPERLPDLPNVPNALEHAKTEEGREIIRAAILSPSAILRAYALPPATPKDRVELLRGAFLATMKDPEFVAEMSKASLSINPLSGAEVEKIALSLFKLQPKDVARLKEILMPGK